MINDDLRTQDDILMYLYKHINKSSSTTDIEASIIGAGFEEINRQFYILDRKNLLRFSERPPLFSEFNVMLHVEITGEGCIHVEKVLQQQEDEQRNLSSRYYY